MSRAEPVRLSLRHPRGVTTILVGRGCLAAARDELAAWVEGRRVFLVTDDRIRGLHGAAVEPLAESAAGWEVLQVPEGEAAKRPEVAEGLWRRMLAAGGKRDSRVIAFGGGSVGDLAGFVAGCFLRGVEYVQLPTTLLAQVDASIGGKTAVDLPEAKNSVGLFHHPEVVVADVDLLATLEAAALREGLVEAVKMGALLDPGLFERIEEKLEAMLGGDLDLLAEVAAGGARAKVGVVEADPEEGDLRRLLNFGHTLGHALEAAAGFSGLRHGEAVGYGMLFAARLARDRGLEPELDRRLRELMARFRLPPLPAVEAEQLLALMARDKKAREGALAWVLPRRLGEGAIVTGIEGEELKRTLAEFLSDPLG